MSREITISLDLTTGKDVTVSSEEIAAVIFPCSDFETYHFYNELEANFETEVKPPRMLRPIQVDWGHYLGKKIPIYITAFCCQIQGKWLCFIRPEGDMFIYTVVEQWVEAYFPNAKTFTTFNFRNCVSLLKEIAKVV